MRRQAMLEAAQAVFAEKGYANATVDEIAQRAEFGKGTLYNYFEGGKEDILFALFDQLYDELCEVIQQTFSPDEAADRPIRAAFRDFVEQNIRYYLEREHLFMILIKEAHRMIFSDDAEKAKYFIRQRDRVASVLVPPLERAMARGEMRPMPPLFVAHLLLGNVNGCQMQLSLEKSGLDENRAEALHAPSQAADYLTTLLFDGLLIEKTAAPTLA